MADSNPMAANNRESRAQTQRIKLGDDASIASWAKHWDVEVDDLNRAILRAGSWAPAVERELSRAGVYSTLWSGQRVSGGR